MVECIATDLATQAIMRGSARITGAMMSKFVSHWLRAAISIAAIFGLLTTAVQGQTTDHGADFTGTYEFVGPLLAIGPCDGVINGKWETRCTNYPYNEAGRQKTIAAVSCPPILGTIRRSIFSGAAVSLTINCDTGL